MCSGTEQKLVLGEVPLFPFRRTSIEMAMWPQWSDLPKANISRPRRHGIVSKHQLASIVIIHQGMEYTGRPVGPCGIFLLEKQQLCPWHPQNPLWSFKRIFLASVQLCLWMIGLPWRFDKSAVPFKFLSRPSSLGSTNTYPLDPDVISHPSTCPQDPKILWWTGSSLHWSLILPLQRSASPAIDHVVIPFAYTDEVMYPFHNDVHVTRKINPRWDGGRPVNHMHLVTWELPLGYDHLPDVSVARMTISMLNGFLLSPCDNLSLCPAGWG